MKQIQLTQGKVALIDDEDFDRVSVHKWYASFESGNKKWYCKRRRKKTDDPKFTAQKIRLHHFILNISSSELQPGYIIDHKDDDGLNCQKENIQIITQYENMQKVKNWKKREPWL